MTTPKKNPKCAPMPRGYRVLAEGEEFKTGDMVCAWPFENWRACHNVGNVVCSREQHRLPEGFYIRRKPAKNKASK